MAGSFWEKMGRSVGDGLQKARDAAASIGEKGEAILDKQELRRRIRRLREELGRSVEKELRGADGPPYQLEDSALKELLADIKLTEEELEKLESAGKEDPLTSEETPATAKGSDLYRERRDTEKKEGDAEVSKQDQDEESGSVELPDPDI